MCGACGLLGGGPDWLDRIGTPGSIGATSGETRLAERHRRIALVNRMLAPSSVRLSDFGSKLMVRSATGKARIVDDLAHVWLAADQIGRTPVDPLDDNWLAPSVGRQ